MTTTYAEARSLLRSVANQIRSCPERMSEEVCIVSAVGRITAKEYVSPITTPTFDSSAMDGFAVVAASTQAASPECPVTFCITACVFAGDSWLTTSSYLNGYGFEPCIEIMTGARFPAVFEDQEQFDAVIKVEDVEILEVKVPCGVLRCINITKPVAKHMHKRLAGSDFRKGELVMPSQELVRPHHVLALASLGFDKVTVVRKLRVGVWSTGHELQAMSKDNSTSSKIKDANSPFIEASLADFGADVDFLGTIDDSESHFVKALRTALRSKHYDVLMSTGAVSKGKLDFVPSALREQEGTIWFHGISMKPGHPVLFATLSTSSEEGDIEQVSARADPKQLTLHQPVPYFGLPGNPIAAAACLRFLVLPFLRSLLGRDDELPIQAKLWKGDTNEQELEIKVAHSRNGLDFFQHGHLSMNRTTGWIVAPNSDQSPAKMKSFSQANCWFHIASERKPRESVDTVDCFLL